MSQRMWSFTAVVAGGRSMRPGERCTVMALLSISADWRPGATVIEATPVPSEVASAWTMYRCAWFAKLKMSPAFTMPVMLAAHPLLLNPCVLEDGDAACAPFTNGVPVATPIG